MISKVVYLDISSFMGISLDASHFYGKLVYTSLDVYQTKELKHPLSEAEAAKLSKAHDWTYKAGDLVEGYDRKDTIVKQAIGEYKTVFPQAIILLEGSPTYSGPHRVLDGPAGLAEKVQDLIVKAGRLGWWDLPKNDAAMSKITESFDKLIAETTGETEFIKGGEG